MIQKRWLSAVCFGLNHAGIDDLYVAGKQAIINDRLYICVQVSIDIHEKCQGHRDSLHWTVSWLQIQFVCVVIVNMVIEWLNLTLSTLLLGNIHKYT
jgi:hypothetical protein